MKNFLSKDDDIAVDLGGAVAGGTPVLVGTLPLVPIADATVAEPVVACKTKGVFDMSVTAEDGVGAQAIAIGDRIYLDGGVLNVDSTNGVAWGYALDALASGTQNIRVMIG